MAGEAWNSGIGIPQGTGHAPEAFRRARLAMDTGDQASVLAASAHLTQLLRFVDQGADPVADFGASARDLDLYVRALGLWRPGVSAQDALGDGGASRERIEANQRAFAERVIFDFQGAIAGRGLDGAGALALVQSLYPGDDVAAMLRDAGIDPATIPAPTGTSRPVIPPPAESGPAPVVAVVDPPAVTFGDTSPVLTPSTRPAATPAPGGQGGIGSSTGASGPALAPLRGIMAAISGVPRWVPFAVLAAVALAVYLASRRRSA